MKSRSAAQRDIRKRVIGKDLTHLQIRQARKATETRRGEFEKARTTDSFGSGLAKGPRKKIPPEELADKTELAFKTSDMTREEEEVLRMRFGIFAPKKASLEDGKEGDTHDLTFRRMGIIEKKAVVAMYGPGKNRGGVQTISPNQTEEK